MLPQKPCKFSYIHGGFCVALAKICFLDARVISYMVGAGAHDSPLQTNGAYGRVVEGADPYRFDYIRTCCEDADKRVVEGADPYRNQGFRACPTRSFVAKRCNTRYLAGQGM